MRHDGSLARSLAPRETQAHTVARFLSSSRRRSELVRFVKAESLRVRGRVCRIVFSRSAETDVAGAMAHVSTASTRVGGGGQGGALNKLTLPRTGIELSPQPGWFADQPPAACTSQRSDSCSANAPAVSRDVSQGQKESLRLAFGP